MLTRLLVKNYVLIDSLEIDFPEGLIIITGQTGAGKSILLGALSLLTGAKADASMLSDGADNCVVEAEFEVNASDSLRTLLEENDVEWDDGHLVVRRVVNRSGRSRSFVNDSPVSVTVLQELSSKLVDVHSQHQTLMLSDKDFQLDILDLFAGNGGLRAACEQAWNVLSERRAELRKVESGIEALAAERDYNEAQYRQLEAASLKEGELAALEEEQKQLANAEDIKMNLSAVEGLFSSSDGDGMSLDALLKETGRMLSRTGRYIPSASDLADRVDACRRELDDILADVQTLNSRADVSPDRLMQVEDRMSLLYGLMKKHSCSDEAELIAFRDRLSEELYDTTRLGERCDELRRLVSEAEEQLDSVASELHDRRVASACGFAESMTSAIRGLELPYAVFEVSVNDARMTPSGRDEVLFSFSAAGSKPVALAKCASGGEMSRIMLALKAMKARFTEMPTMIFDEIDTGVSGSVADRMGSMICDMGQDMQVFAITHLPQVAAKGQAHYLVSKEFDPATSKAVSTISRLSGEDRIMEVARMLSGSVLTEAAVENAKSLLNLS